MRRFGKKKAAENRLRKVMREKSFEISRIYSSAWFQQGFFLPVGCCARCRGLFPLEQLDLDEVDEGRHLVDGIPAALHPGHQQLLCRKCHYVKTDLGHVDYLALNFPEVRKMMGLYGQAILEQLPTLPGKVKHTWPDIQKAVRAASKTILSQLPPPQEKPSFCFTSKF